MSEQGLPHDEDSAFGAATTPTQKKQRSPLKRFEHLIELFIFGSRWIQAPMYAGLIIAQLVYAYKFATELITLIIHATRVSEEELIIAVLSLVDITMVANLITMIVIGGYATFVSKLNVDAHEDRPEWLDKIDAAMMKIKLASSLVGISSIHLLKAFIDLGRANEGGMAQVAGEVVHATPSHDFEALRYQILIHVLFLVSTVVLAGSERVLHGPTSHTE